MIELVWFIIFCLVCVLLCCRLFSLSVPSRYTALRLYPNGQPGHVLLLLYVQILQSTSHASIVKMTCVTTVFVFLIAGNEMEGCVATGLGKIAEYITTFRIFRGSDNSKDDR